MSVLLDASAIISLFVKQRWTERTIQFLDSRDRRPVVSDFAAGETVAGLLRLERIGDLLHDVTANAITDFDQWRVAHADVAECVSADVRVAAQLVRRADLLLRMPDAIHLAIAQRLAVPLLTFDRRMRDAATSLGIPLKGPSPD